MLRVYMRSNYRIQHVLHYTQQYTTGC